MAEYENNHYVPQLILRRYGEKINRYNLKTKEYIPYGNIKSCFKEKNLYPLDLELKLRDIESKFADLLNNKILNATDEIILYRHEIALIKKFLVLQTFRVPDALVEKPGAKDRPEFSEKLYGYKEKTIEGESFKDYIFRTMRVIIDSESLEKIPTHPDVTYEAIKWMLLYNNCYLTFWDSKESGEDFIITDRGMTCEHEKTRFQFEHLGLKEELIKEGYMLSHIMDPSTSKDMKEKYLLEGEKSRFVYANYYMFSISENRMIGLINPWYRLHFDENRIKWFNGTPDVFPCMLSKEALEPNTNRYVNQNKSIDGAFYGNYFDPKDEYIYKIKDLSFKDVCIINCMMLDRVSSVVGFVDTKRIVKSLNVYTNLYVHLNDYSELKRILFENGYDFPKTKKLMDIAFGITYINFTPEEQKYINFIINLKNKMKNVKI